MNEEGDEPIPPLNLFEHPLDRYIYRSGKSRGVTGEGMENGLLRNMGLTVESFIEKFPTPQDWFYFKKLQKRPPDPVPRRNKPYKQKRHRVVVTMPEELLQAIDKACGGKGGFKGLGGYGRCGRSKFIVDLLLQYFGLPVTILAIEIYRNETAKAVELVEKAKECSRNQYRTRFARTRIKELYDSRYGKELRRENESI